jgi:hypothetical protein
MSFAGEIRRVVMASPRVKLPELRSALYKAFAAGQISEAEAEELDTLINAKAAIPAPQKPVQRRVGSRPRSSASMERRRSWAAAGRLPPKIAARFTLAEQAVLAVVAVEVMKRGSCALAHGHLAALAGVCVSTVKNAMRAAHGLGLIRIEERRQTAWRNLPNLVTIISPEWLSWLRIGPKGGGVKFVTGTNTKIRRERENGISPAAFEPESRSRNVWETPEKGFRRGRAGGG